MKILCYPAISLDGFIAKSDGDSNWVSPEEEHLFAEEVRKAGCVIVGRRTFEQYKDVIYPLAEGTTFVCTSRSQSFDSSTYPGVKCVGGSVETIIKEIEAAGFTSAILSGGAETNGRFAQAQAINEILISIYPHLFGTGLPIFGQHQIQLRLSLLSTRQLSEGVVQNRYQVIS